MSIAPFDFIFRDEKTHPPEIQLLEIHPWDVVEKKDPCAWVYVRRVEKYTFSPGTTFAEEASITVSHQAVETHRGPTLTGGWTFVASYSRRENRISLTGLSPYGRGGIMVADGLRGMRFGTYVFNIIVGWAKQWPSAEINIITLSENDAYPENRKRRNWFYEQFGLEFDYTDAQHKSGRSLPMLASKLQHVTTWEKNIVVHRVDDHLGKILQQNYRLQSDLIARERGISELTKRMDYQAAHPFRTLLYALWVIHAQWLIPLLIILGLAAAWFRQH